MYAMPMHDSIIFDCHHMRDSLLSIESDLWQVETTEITIVNLNVVN